MASEPNNHSETARMQDEERKKFFAEHQHDMKPMRKKEKTAFWKWFEDMFLSGRTWKDILMDILNNQLVPEFKDGVRNGLVSLIDMRFYKDSGPSTPGTPGSSGSFITNYVSYGSKTSQTKAALEANKKKEEETLKKGYEIPSFTDLLKARKFLKDLHEYVDKFYRISVLDLMGWMHKSVDYTWDKWGWEKEEILAITAPKKFVTPVVTTDAKGNRVVYTHYIDLPKAHELTD